MNPLLPVDLRLGVLLRPRRAWLEPRSPSPVPPASPLPLLRLFCLSFDPFGLPLGLPVECRTLQMAMAARPLDVPRG